MAPAPDPPPPRSRSFLLDIPGYVATGSASLSLIGDLLVTLNYFSLIKTDTTVFDFCALPMLTVIAGVLGNQLHMFHTPLSPRCRRLSRIGLLLLVVHILFIAVAAYVSGMNVPPEP